MMNTMTGKERIRLAFERAPVDRTPWVPFVGCHGGYLLDLSATDFLKSSRHVVAGLEKAIELYRPDGIPIMFDLQVEAEALGCQLTWAARNPPAVSSHIVKTMDDLSKLAPPEPTAGRIPVCLEATREIARRHPDLAIYGLITGPFTLAFHLLGMDLLTKMMRDKPLVAAVMSFCERVARRMADYYIDAGADIIAVVDPMTSQISPNHFKNFVLPAASNVFGHIREHGALSSFFVCGDAKHNLDAMCECKPDNCSVDENIPLELVRDICTRREISFGGNLQLTVALLMGTAGVSQERCHLPRCWRRSRLRTRARM